MEGIEKIEKITNEQIKACGVQALADRPNDSAKYGAGGLTPTELKRWFDKLSEVLAGKINGLIDVIYDGKAQDHISITFYGEKIKLSDFIKKFDSGELAGNILKLYPSALAEELQSLQSVINAIDKAIKDNAEVIGAELGATLDISVDEAQQLKVRLFSREDKQGERKELYSHSVSLIAGTERIADGAVTNGKLAAKSVTSEKIADGAVGTAAMADSSVTGEKLKNSSITYDKLSKALLDRLLSLENHLFQMQLEFAYGSFNGDETSEGYGEVYYYVDENGNAREAWEAITPNLIRANKPISSPLIDSGMGVLMYDVDGRCIGILGMYSSVQDAQLLPGTEYIRIYILSSNNATIPLVNGHLEGFKYWDDYYALELEERLEALATAPVPTSRLKGDSNIDLDGRQLLGISEINFNRKDAAGNAWLRMNPAGNKSLEVQNTEGGFTIGTATGHVNLYNRSGGNSLIHGVETPVLDTDAANKKFVRELAPKGHARGRIVRLDDVSPIPHTLDIKVGGASVNGETSVTCLGKNLIDPAELIIEGFGESITLVDDKYTIDFATLKGANALSKNVDPGTYMFSVIPMSDSVSLALRAYSLSGEILSTKYVENANTPCSFSFSYNDPVCIKVGGYRPTSGKWKEHSFKVMLEVGAEATEYEPYIPPITYYPEAPGVVLGVESISPVTTLIIDAEDGVLDVGYSKDINRVVERLENAIISLGGNI